MFQRRLHDQATLQTYFHWFSMSFVSGFVNVGGFLSCQRFVTHVTGFATLSGIEFSKLNILEGLGVLSIPIYFLMGVVISGYMTERMLATHSQQKRFAPVIGLVAIFLALAAVLGELDWFGKFGDPAVLRHDYVLLAILCTASGIQNAALTSSSGATVRTTHLTGLTTDLGLGLIRAELRTLSTNQREKERLANLIRLGFIASFVMGSAIGAGCFIKMQYLGFLIPSLVCLYSFISTFRR